MRGLSEAEAAQRLEAEGRNELPREPPTPAWKAFGRQLANPMSLLLMVTAGVAAGLGQMEDGIAIAAILLLNAFVGFIQEHRAERALRALGSLTAPRARVLRDGRSRLIPAAEVVRGDVMVLEAGDRVAADGRLVEAHALSTLEAALTGESAPVEKRLEPAPADAPLAERHDRVFLGTSIAGGTGIAEVEATGPGTELGRVARLLASAEQGPTPLQKRLEGVTKALALMCLGVVAVVAASGALRREPWMELVLISLSLAVAAVPEGLPAIVTIALAIGVQRMAARNVLVRRLPAVETLGCATVICTDKTGTLTRGEMAVRKTWGPDERALFSSAAACCDAELLPDGRAAGDPMEVAILHAAAARGITREELERSAPRLEVKPFDPAVRRMSVRRADGRRYVKGAVESLLPLCDTGTEGALEAAAGMAAEGLRVLAVAVGEGEADEHLRLVGLIGLADPPRPEAIQAVAAARRAGIRTVMITGDHPITAGAIAREMGILAPGEEPDGLIHARATPEDKLRLVREWKRKGAVVAMTGDGVNDGPALKEAHVGIAMGRGGTEVARQAADLVLADDDFASIVAGIGEGRGIYRNIRKTLVYLLGGNAAELAVMLLASLAGQPPPLLPLQLLWINLVTDGLPALALVMDPTPSDILERPPRSPEEPILGRPQWLRVAFIGALDALVTLAAYTWGLRHGGLAEARDLAFTVLVFAEVFRAFAARSGSRTFWEVGTLTNVRLLAVVLGTACLQVGLHAVGPARALLDLNEPSGRELLMAGALGLFPVTILELQKLVRRRSGEGPARQWPPRRRAAEP